MEFVRFLHVLLGAIWMGGAMYGESMVAISAKGGRDVWARTHIRVQQTSSRIYPIIVPLTAVSAVVLIMGSDHLDWADTWISAAFGLWLVGLIVGIAYFTRREKDFVARLESDGVTDELVADLRKTTMIQRLDLLVLVALLVLMIFQPGA